MVTSSIMKDMQSNSEVIYRPNAIRALCKIIDVRHYFCFTETVRLMGVALNGARCRAFL